MLLLLQANVVSFLKWQINKWHWNNNLKRNYIILIAWISIFGKTNIFDRCCLWFFGELSQLELIIIYHVLVSASKAIKMSICHKILDSDASTLATNTEAATELFFLRTKSTINGMYQKYIDVETIESRHEIQRSVVRALYTIHQIECTCVSKWREHFNTNKGRVKVNDSFALCMSNDKKSTEYPHQHVNDAHSMAATMTSLTISIAQNNSFLLLLLWTTMNSTWNN